MAEINAAMVKKLRERSGLPMMDCKQALQEAGGDEEQAMEMLRKRGATAAEKKAGRATAEGRIGSYVDLEKGTAAIVELLCETAPVANNPEFRELADKLARHAALTGDAQADTIRMEKFIDDPATTIQDVLHDVLNRLRENMQIARVVRRQGGRPAAYVHHTGKIGVMIVTEGQGSPDMLNDVCMHIAAMQPDAITRDQMPAELVTKEEEIARVQVKESGKPDNLIDKIVEGKMNRFYSERVLLEQPFVKDDKVTVGQLLEKEGVKLTEFVRLQVGIE